MTAKDNKTIVTIGREYGSGGLEIATIIAKELGFPIYDKKLISMAGSASGLSSRLLDLVDEHSMNVYIEASSAAAAALTGTEESHAVSLNDQLYNAQRDILLNIAADGPCVIVGRTADYVLRDDPALITIFVHASMPFRVSRIMHSDGLSEERAAEEIHAIDAQRSSYYEAYTGRQWGHMNNYNITIDSELLDIKGTAAQLTGFIKSVMERRASTAQDPS